MIQRIQSLYLFLTSIVSIIFLKGPFLTFFDKSGSEIRIAFSGIFKYSSNTDPVKMAEDWPIPALVLLILSLSLLIIFLYKNRGLQIRLSKILILLISAFLGACLFYSYKIITGNEAEFASWFKLSLPVIQLILALLAYRGIKKDDNLVKSYDRLR